jgi:hypothetical protein
MARKSKETEGNFIKVPIDEKHHGYARIVVCKYYAFYNIYTDIELSLEEIAEKPILFTICVYKYAVTKGIWQVVGHLPLEPPLQIIPKFYMQDMFDYSQIRICEEGIETPSTYEECKDLECCAVWLPENVEERLRNYHNNTSNTSLQIMRLKHPSEFNPNREAYLKDYPHLTK